MFIESITCCFTAWIAFIESIVCFFAFSIVIAVSGACVPALVVQAAKPVMVANAINNCLMVKIFAFIQGDAKTVPKMPVK